jgi:2-amino-4-hydroxy-6-hydroxymethyldihydropteridine diphosphokinase
MTKIHTVYLSLGSNLGERKKILDGALQLLEMRVGHVERVSSFYETEPWGFSSSNKFINVCACCISGLSPRGVLEVTQQIEIELGRTKKSCDRKYYDRLIDIDILLYDDKRIDEPDLTIPHPYMEERLFVMKHLKEILFSKI